MNTPQSKEQQEKLETPVSDGDSRPDQVDNDPDRKKHLTPDKGKVTAERGADVDSADDFRDAKRS